MFLIFRWYCTVFLSRYGLSPWADNARYSVISDSNGTNTTNGIWSKWDFCSMAQRLRFIPRVSVGIRCEITRRLQRWLCCDAWHRPCFRLSMPVVHQIATPARWPTLRISTGAVLPLAGGLSKGTVRGFRNQSIPVESPECHIGNDHQSANPSFSAAETNVAKLQDTVSTFLSELQTIFTAENTRYLSGPWKIRCVHQVLWSSVDSIWTLLCREQSFVIRSLNIEHQWTDVRRLPPSLPWSMVTKRDWHRLPSASTQVERSGLYRSPWNTYWRITSTSWWHRWPRWSSRRDGRSKSFPVGSSRTKGENIETRSTFAHSESKWWIGESIYVSGWDASLEQCANATCRSIVAKRGNGTCSTRRWVSTVDSNSWMQDEVPSAIVLTTTASETLRQRTTGSSSILGHSQSLLIFSSIDKRVESDQQSMNRTDDPETRVKQPDMPQVTRSLPLHSATCFFHREMLRATSSH